MKPRHTLAALAALVALSTFVYFHEFRGAPAREEARRREERLLAFEPGKVMRLSVEKAGTRVAAERRGEAWSLTEPLVAEADKVAVSDLLSTLEGLRREGEIAAGDAADRHAFGLAPADAVVRLGLDGGGGEVTLEVGGAVPVGGGRYVAVGERVLVTGAAVARLSEVTSDTLRDKALARLQRGDVKTITLERASGRVCVEKRGERWQLTAPDSVPADRGWASDLLFNLTTLRALSFPSGAALPAEDKLELTPPRVRARLDGDAGQSEEFLIGATTAPGISPAGVYARRSGGPLAIVATSVQEVSERSVEQCRDRHPLALDRWNLVSLAVSGGVATDIKRGAEGATWTRADGTAIDAEASRALFDALGDLEADEMLTVPGAPLADPLLVLKLQDQGGAAQEIRVEAERPGRPPRAATDLTPLLYRLPAGSRDKIQQAVQHLTVAPSP